MRRNIDMIYLILLGSTIGAILTIGIIMTSTIFNSQLYIGPILSHYQEGKIMAQGFNKFSYFLSFMAVVIIFYEMDSYKRAKRDTVVLISTLISLLSIALFIGVYMPKILQIQQEGEASTQSELFQKIHLGSEIDFKILVFSLIILMGRRLYLLLGRERNL